MSSKSGEFVWAIEQGCYSDYHVVGVFTSRKNAKAVVDALKAAECYGDEPTIARWPLDPAVKDLRAGMSPWRVLMLRDGTVESAKQRDVSSFNIAGSVAIWRRSTAPAYKGTGIPDCLDATVWAKDRNHAIKIANEHRTHMIADGQWH